MTKLKTEHKTVTSPQVLSFESSSAKKYGYGKASQNLTESPLLPPSTLTKTKSKKKNKMSSVSKM